MAEDDNKTREEKALVEWLQMVDKPVGTKGEGKKDTGSGNEQE